MLHAHAEVLEVKRKAWYLKLSGWEKAYYVMGLLGAGVVVYTRVDWDGSKAAAEEVGRGAHDGSHRLQRLVSALHHSCGGHT